MILRTDDDLMWQRYLGWGLGFLQGADKTEGLYGEKKERESSQLSLTITTYIVVI